MSRQASGLQAWVVQRATAVYLGIVAVYLLIHFTVNAPSDFAAFHGWLSRPLVSGALLLFIPVLLAHAWVGVRDVLMDYVHPLGIRVVLLTLFALMLIASGLWMFKAIVTAGITG